MDAHRRATPRAYKELTLQQLRSFHAVCRLGGYAAAGRQLMLTPPAVWEQIQALERYYGAQLLVREGNGMAPTPEGRRLVELTLPLLAGLDAARNVFQQEQGLWPESIRLASNLRVFAAEISRGLRSFQQQHPQIRLELAFLRDDPLMEAVLGGEADVALTLEPGPRGLRRGLVYEVCGAADYLLVAPPGHPVSISPRLTLKDLVQYPLVLGDRETFSRQRVQEVFHRHHLTDAMQIAAETNSDEYSTLCVRSGMGIAITIGSGAAALYQGLAVRPLKRWFGRVHLGYLWKAGALQSRSQTELARHLIVPLVARKRRAD